MSTCSGTVLFFLIGLCVSLLRHECKREWQVNNKTSYDITVKHLLHGYLRKTRLWRRVAGERPGTRHSRGKGRPVVFLIGILLLSGDVEVNPGPKTKTRAADKGINWLWNVVCDIYIAS